MRAAIPRPTQRPTRVVSELKHTSGSAQTWSIAAIVISVLLLVAGWFLLVSPVLAEASETRSTTEDQEAENDIARQEVNQLRADFARMDEYEAELAALQEQVTTTQRYADLQRLIAQVAEDNDVVVTSLTFGTAEEIAPPAAPAPVEEESDDEATEDDDDAAADAEADEPATPAATGIANLFGIEVTLEFVGRYSDVLQAIDDLQTGDQRIVLFTAMDLSGAPASTPGVDDGADLTLAELEGLTFVLADPDAIAEREEPEFNEDELVAPEPLPQSGDSPLTPGDD